jgi:hypothetical protein
MSDEEEGTAATAKSAGDNSQIEVYGRCRPSAKNDPTTTILNEGTHCSSRALHTRGAE